MAAICDRWQHLCLGLALWNGQDPILKERLFGLANHEGNHGEDVKELWWPIDGLPSHAWHRWCYRYPQRRFPYEQLRDENARRTRNQPELELIDTGIFDDHRFFDVELVMAKVAPNDVCLRYDVTNHGPEAATLHVLPQAWFRNTWAWGRDDRYPSLTPLDDRTVLAQHQTLGRFQIAFDPSVPMMGDGLLFTDNESNGERLWGSPSRTPYVKDGFHDHVIDGAATVNPERVGTKTAAWYRLELAPGATASIRVRVRPDLPDLVESNPFGPGFAETFALRRARGRRLSRFVGRRRRP